MHSRRRLLYNRMAMTLVKSVKLCTYSGSEGGKDSLSTNFAYDLITLVFVYCLSGDTCNSKWSFNHTVAFRDLLDCPFSKGSTGKFCQALWIRVGLVVIS